MAADAENVCCAAWKKKYAKILEKYSKVEELKNKFRDCTSLVNQQYDVIEKENERLKQELGNLKAQEGKWKDEKEQEYSIRVALENEISILKKEIQLLQQNGKDASNKSGRKLQERLDVAELQINQLKELLEKERHRADLEKKNAEVGRKKANEALKKLEAGSLSFSRSSFSWFICNSGDYMPLDKCATKEKKKINKDADSNLVIKAYIKMSEHQGTTEVTYKALIKLSQCNQQKIT